jgi:hypothetical protein
MNGELRPLTALDLLLWIGLVPLCSVWIYFSFRDDFSSFLRQK